MKTPPFQKDSMIKGDIISCFLPPFLDYYPFNSTKVRWKSISEVKLLAA